MNYFDNIFLQQKYKLKWISSFCSFSENEFFIFEINASENILSVEPKYVRLKISTVIFFMMDIWTEADLAEILNQSLRV